MQRRILSIITIIIVLSIYSFLNSSMFFVEELEWQGLEYLEAEELAQWTGFEPQNVFRVDREGLSEQISGYTWIESVGVNWDWPNHLIVSVEESRPIAIVPVADSWYILDELGHLMPPYSGDLNFSQLPLVTNADLDDQEQFMIIARYLEKAPKEFYQSISEWNAANQSLITRTGCHVLFGDLRNIEEKFIRLELILADLAKRGVVAQRIDLRVLDSPVILE